MCSWTKASEDLKEKMSRMAAASAWGRGACLYLCLPQRYIKSGPT